MNGLDDLKARCVEHLGQFSGDGFKGVVDQAVVDGMSIPEILDLLIAPAQHWVGTQWESGAWNVAQEHRATAIALRTVDALPVADSPIRGPVLITCAEGEWHTLELSMVSVGLQSQGYETVTLGGPLPSGQLIPLLHELAPLCVTVSCQMPGNLPGARRMAATVRGAGTPVVMGGSAITNGRAKHLGANAHAQDIRDLSQAIKSVQMPVEAIEPLTHGRATGFEWIEFRMPKLAAQISDPNKNLSTEAVLDGVWMLRCLSAALLCDEPAIVKTQADWQQRRSEVAGSPTASELLRAVLAVVDSGPPIVAATLTDGAGYYLG